MNDSHRRNESIDRLLTSLGSARPEGEFEARVLAGIAARQSVRAKRREGWIGAFGLVAAAAVLVALLIPYDAHRLPQNMRGPKSPSPSLALAVPSAVARMESVATRIPSSRPRQRQHHVRLLSFPAPEAPLTEQEKVLLAAVRQGDPGELAMLNPEIQKEQEARQKSAFHQVFEAPIPGFDE